MVRDNPLLRHRHTHRPARAELSLGLDAGILTFCSPQIGPAGGQLNGTTMVRAAAAQSVASGRVEVRPSRSM